MATGQITGPTSVLDMTFKVASSNTITGFQAVKLSGNGGEVALANSGTASVIGIAQVNPLMNTTYTAGKFVTVRMLGVSTAIAGGAITSGGRVTVSSGVGEVDDTGSAGDIVVGIALCSAWARGELINVLLTPGVVRHA
jgi:hypothetical protein